MYASAAFYIKQLGKRDNDKMFVLEGLGSAMRAGGMAYPSEHLYGQSLSLLGTSLINLSTSQSDMVHPFFIEFYKERDSCWI